jgi:PAS domain S-box-containing protein
MPPASSRSRFLRPRRTSLNSQLASSAVAVLLGGGALAAALLLDGPQRPVALICVFAVLLSALIGGHVSGWICLAITSMGFWIIAPHVPALRSSNFESTLVLWSAYVALCVLLIAVIRRLQQERKRLLEHDQRLRLARRAAHIWFWEWDLQRNLLRWSRETDSGKGKREYHEVPLEVYVKRRIHPEDQERILTALFEAAAGHQRLEVEFRVFESDGSLHWLSAKGKIFEEDHSAVMLGMASDITAQKQAEEVRSHFHAVLGSMTEGVCYIDTLDAIQYMNAAAERMLGYSSDEVRGKPLHDLVHAHCDSNGESCCFFEAIQARHPCSAQEETFTTKSGGMLIAEYTAAPVTSDGITLGGVVTFRDISDRKRAEQALRASEKMAATGRIAATISHELRNPLDSVTQLLYLVKQSDKLGDSERQQLDLIDHELGRMTEVAQQTLALHRQSSSMVPVNLAKLIDGILLLYGKRIRSQNVRIDKGYKWQGEIPGFPAELRQVFTNLIVNAVDSMPSGGKLRIQVRRYREPAGLRREGVLVALLDSGVGIPRNVRKRMFEPFFTTKGEKGSGVGLWVSSGIVQRHNGSIRVHSDPRPGRSYTCFEVFLPEKQPQIAAKPGEVKTQPPASSPAEGQTKAA